MKLTQNNLRVLPPGIPKPSYDRNVNERFIVHMGVGGFHRAHQAFYLDELMNKGHSGWAICGMGVMKEDERIYNALRGQDYLYTLIVRHPNGTVRPRVIGSIVDYVFVPANPAAAVERLADPRTAIVSLTITEGGYNFDQNGEFIFGNPDVQWDIRHPEAPRTVFGLLAAALRLRWQRGIPPFTVLSCDNIQHNGLVTRRMLLSFTGAADRELSEWIRGNVSFPGSMVDRITPATTEGDIELLAREYGIEDSWPVTCEPFVQWVLEDDFPGGRPEWEQAGVQFVRDIEPYEKVKLRLLNAGHSMLGFFGSLMGYRTIDEAVGDPLVRKSLRAFMDEEATPTLGNVDGIDLAWYKDNLIERFGNPNIKDALSRICSESSDKLPKFLVPTLREQLAAGGQIKYCAAILAAWCRTLELYAAGRYGYPLRDAMLDRLSEAAARTAETGAPDFLETSSVFGDLAADARFRNEFMERLQRIRTAGVEETLLDLSKQ